ncbi:MAG: hypothetical protein CL572_03845 [Alphaproteobacteria bacterium]|nr:hypothetical protein [Alphaproteobacteria bacterium]|tara:strand:+ start:1011 stop:1667 length:657 start_codon:yes stop_codon:yes gene_type:complete
MNKKFKCVVFDLDGTLIDSGPDLLDSLNFVLKKKKLKTIDKKVLGNLVGGGAEAMIRRGYNFLKVKLENKIIPELIDIFLKYYELNCTNKSQLYPNIKEILSFLKKKQVKICICTNKKQFLADKIIQNLDLSDYFDLIIGSQKSLKLKPHTDMLKKCIENLGVKFSETVFVGDSVNDVIPAKELGIISAFVTYGYGKLENSIEPDIKISNILKLKKFF